MSVAVEIAIEAGDWEKLARPAEKISLAVNLKTATLLGVNVPRKILLRADMLRR